MLENVSAITFLNRVGSDFLVVTLESSQILTGLGEFTFLHTLTNVPVDEGTLAVHEIEFVGEGRPGLRDGSGVGEHAAVEQKLAKIAHIEEEVDLHSAVDLGEVTIGHHLGWLIADTNLEASWAPVDELDCFLGFESGDSRVNLLWHDITSVEQASSHVLANSRITLDHLVVWLEAGVGDLLNRVGLVGRLGGRDDGCVCDEREVDSWIGDQVGLELVKVDVQRAIESERGGDGRDDCGMLAGFLHDLQRDRSP